MCFSCNSDDDLNDEVLNEEQEIDLTAFLEDEIPQFTGLLNNEVLSMKFGPSAYQIASSFSSNPDDDSQRLLQSALIENSGDNYFKLITPFFDVDSQEEFNGVFGLGNKDIGYYYDDFFFDFQIDGERYQTCGPQDGGELEVLQVQEITDAGNMTFLFVWFKLSNLNLVDYCTLNNDYVLEEGLILARFYGYN